MAVHVAMQAVLGKRFKRLTNLLGFGDALVRRGVLVIMQYACKSATEGHLAPSQVVPIVAPLHYHCNNGR
jgi:hypothetical protein